jgi:hypothetical protein
MANDPPFATLNHFAGDLEMPEESQSLSGLVLGSFADATVLKTFGEVPEKLDEL